MGGKIPSEHCPFFQEWLGGASKANSNFELQHALHWGLCISNPVGVMPFKSSALQTSPASLAWALAAERLGQFLLKGSDEISGCFPSTTVPACWTAEPCSRMPAAEWWKCSEITENLVLTYCEFAVFTILNLPTCGFGQFGNVYHVQPPARMAWLQCTHAANVPGAHRPEQLRYLGYNDGETGWGGSKGSCKKPYTCLERSFKWFNFFFVVVGLFCGTWSTCTDWHTPGPQNEHSLGCEAVSGFHRGLGLTRQVTPVSLGLQCKYLENVTLLGLSNGRPWVKWTSVRTAKSRLLMVSWGCTCKFAWLEHDAFAAGTHSRLQGCLPFKQQLGLVLYLLISHIWHMGPGKGRGAVPLHCSQLSTTPGSPLLFWASWVAASCSPGPHGGEPSYTWGIKPKRPLCFGKTVNWHVVPLWSRTAWCLWWGLEGESRTGTTKARWQWGLCLAGVSTVVALSQQLDSVRGTVQLEMLVDDM